VKVRQSGLAPRRYVAGATGKSRKAPGASVVDSAKNLGQSASTAVDGTGWVHIAYSDATNGDLRYAFKANGMTFSAPQTLDANNVTGTYTAIAVDSSGRVHIAYKDETTDDLRYITRAGGSANFSAPITVESTNNVGNFISLAVNSMNEVAITHYDSSAQDLRLATKASSAGSFTTSVVQSMGNAGAYSAVRYAPNGTLHIAYALIVPTAIGTTTYQYADLRHAERPMGSSTFTFRTLDGPANTNSGTYISLAASPSNNVMHVVYYDVSNTDLRHQHRCP